MTLLRREKSFIKTLSLLLGLLIFLFPFPSFSYEVSDHHDGEKFFNPEGDQLKGFWQVLKWKMTSKRVEWPEHVPNKNYPLPDLPSNQKINLTFINHSTFLLKLKGLTILTDPIFSDRASPLSFAGPKRVRGAGIPLELLPPIDVVVISHNHYDHLDEESIKLLDGKFHPLFLVPLGDEELLKKWGVQNVKAMDWWNEERVKDVKFIFTPALHWSARGLTDKNKCLWGSFMIDDGKSKIYFAGDTGFGKHFSEIRKRLGPPDLALLPIGAYKPQWFMHHYHLNPEEAVLAHLELKSTQSIAMHFGTFQMSDEGIEEPVLDLKRALEKFGLGEKDFFILDQGESFSWSQ